MDTKLILNFLQDLNENNSLDWMKDNKKYYEQARIECEDLIQELISSIKTFDNSIKNLSAKDLMFRLNKDTRFSNDKSPYNPSFRAHISKNGKLPVPVGYYINIKPNNIFLGGGLFASMFTEATKSIREYIVRNENKFMEIVKTKEFRDNFVIDGDKLKNVPKEYDKEHKLAEHLKYKSWFIEYKVEDSVFLDNNNFIKTSMKVFKYIKPFNDFLNKALKDFKMPERK
jgi:uncharacterized protein (TIGR02453 family)